MFGWLRKAFPKYMIIKDPQYGYCAAHRDSMGWWCIKADGTTGVAQDSAVKFPSFYFVGTPEEAGQRVNLHTTSRGQSVVWEG